MSKKEKPTNEKVTYRCVNPRCSKYKKYISIDKPTWKFHEKYDKWLCDQVYCEECGRYGIQDTVDGFMRGSVKVSSAQGKKSY